MTTTIAVYCDTLRQAERKQEQLYKRYWDVKLIYFPSSSEDGTYIWKCSQDKDTRVQVRI